MKSIEICIKDAVSFAEKQYEANKTSATEAIAKLHDGNGEGNDFLGWLNLPLLFPPTFSTESTRLLNVCAKTANM